MLRCEVSCSLFGYYNGEGLVRELESIIFGTGMEEVGDMGANQFNVLKGLQSRRLYNKSHGMRKAAAGLYTLSASSFDLQYAYQRVKASSYHPHRAVPIARCKYSIRAPRP